jgi:hypothetical protein
MKKLLTLSLVVVLLVGIIGSFSFAELALPSKYDNWSAEFGNNKDVDNFSDDGGTVVANYVKGKKSYLVSVDLWGLEAGSTYMLVYTKDAADNNTWNPMTLKYFVTDEQGNAEFSIQGWKIEDETYIFDSYFSPEDGTSHFNVFSAPGEQRKSPWVLSTMSGRSANPLTASGSNRGE